MTAARESRPASRTAEAVRVGTVAASVTVAVLCWAHAAAGPAAATVEDEPTGQRQPAATTLDEVEALFVAVRGDADDLGTLTPAAFGSNTTVFGGDLNVTGFLVGAVSQLVAEEIVDGGEQVSVASDILFPFDSAELEPGGAELVTEVVAEAPQGGNVAVIGHTDSISDDAYNLQLSLQRAEAVAAVVRQQRSDLTVTTEGRGETEPVADETVNGEDNPAGRAQNRRVTLLITGVNGS